jgi:uncharacterized protein (DUF2147 family)
VLDTDNGKIYRIKEHLSDDGNTLEVRGCRRLSGSG